MKLVSAAPTLITIKVKDSKGNVWEVSQADCQSRRTRYSDFQGPDIYENKLSVTTPAEHGGEVLVVPPVAEWKEGVVYNGVLSHPGGSIQWS
jgi:hypothetical protein